MRISDWSSDVCSSDLAGQSLCVYGPQFGLLFVQLSITLRQKLEVCLFGGQDQTGFFKAFLQAVHGRFAACKAAIDMCSFRLYASRLLTGHRLQAAKICARQKEAKRAAEPQNHK